MFGKLGKVVSQEAAQSLAKENPVYRLSGGIQRLGAQVRPEDTRTPAQVLATMEEIAKRNSDI